MLHILIVEDDSLTAMYLEDVINGISTANIVIRASVADTKKALNKCFDVAFLDVDVTNGKTFDVARALQRKQIPFVFVSGSSRAELPDELQSAPFISKPFLPNDIAGALYSVLSGHRER
jgi:DNA-binding NarL/FixJ family response regulator